MKKKLVYLPFFLSILIAVKIISISPLANDSYLHLGIGRFITEERRIPNHRDISYKDVEPSLEWISHSWLSDAIFSVATSSNVYVGTLIVLCVTFALCLFLLYKILGLLHSSFLGKVVALFFAAVLASGVWKLHPLIFLPLLVLALFYVYVHWRTYDSNRIVLLPFIFLVWANLIGGYIAIAGLFVVFILIVELFHQISDGSLRKYPRLLVFSLLSLSLTLVNPFTWRIWTYAITSWSILTNPAKYSGTLMGLLSTIDQSFIRSAPATSFSILFLGYALMTVLLCSYLVVRFRLLFFKKIAIALPVALFFLLPLRWIRFVGVAIFATMPFFVLELDFFMSKQKKISRIATICIIIAITASTLIIAFHAPAEALSTPKKELEVIQEMHLPDNLFTTFDLTSYTYYALYPKKVFLDAQDDFFDENDTVDFYFTSEQIPKVLFDKIAAENNMNTVLTNKTLGSLAQTLNKDKEWVLVYFDTTGYVFVKKLAVSINFLEKNSINYLDLSRNLGFDPKKMTETEDELTRFVERYPYNALALGQLATVYRLQKRFDEAQKILARIPKENQDVSFFTEMGRLKAAQGDCASSEKNYLLAIDKKQEQNFSRAILDLAVLYAGCFQDKQKAKHYFLRYNSFILPQEERIKFDNLAKQFGVSLDDD